MLKRPTVATIALAMSVNMAAAGFQHWDVETENDPFASGKHIVVDFSTSERSGVVIFCETSGGGIRVRSIPGFDYDSILDAVKPEASFAIDGKVLFKAGGSTGSVGNNLAAVDVELDAEKAKEFVTTFSAATKQVAVDDGIADKPQLLSATGSTASGKALVECMSAQKGN